MKKLVYFVGGGFLTSMILSQFTPLIPNKEIIPIFYYTCGFAIHWLCYKDEKKEVQ